MVVPVLAALAAPVTLVLQAADPRTRAVVRRGLRHPVVVIVCPARWSASSCSACRSWSSRSPRCSTSPPATTSSTSSSTATWWRWGCVFAWPLVGVDPVPSRPGHAARLLLVLAAVPFHTFVGVALLGARSPLFDAYPSLADQRRGAGVLWGSGELLTRGGGGGRVPQLVSGRDARWSPRRPTGRPWGRSDPADARRAPGQLKSWTMAEVNAGRSSGLRLVMSRLPS